MEDHKRVLRKCEGFSLGKDSNHLGANVPIALNAFQLLSLE